MDYGPFAVLDPEFFASFEERAPDAEFRSLVLGMLGESEWAMLVHGIWTHVHPVGWEGPRQGWKLHVSAAPTNAETVLERVAAVLRHDPAAFKFASDRVVHRLIHAKNWPREGGGKFITVYPRDEEHFRRLAQALAAATEGMDGPYVLSDRRVPGSRIVFYRFGEHLAHEQVDARGVRMQRVVGPDGTEASDARRGVFDLPEWVEDPYGARPVRRMETSDARVTLTPRFEVRGAIGYSNAGGVYRGHDLELDEAVVIRERRPHVGYVDDATDGVALLEKEARILQAMEGSGWAPRLHGCFRVWEHHYLAMEQVDGMPLRDYAMRQYFRRSALASPRRLFWTMRHLVLQLLRGIEEFHRRGIILRDLSVFNVLVRPDRSLCFIDFEFAWEKAGTQPYAARIHTPGFASPEQMQGRAPSEADDLYALGAVVVELCSALAPGLGLNRTGMMAAAEMAVSEVGLPRELLEVAHGLMHPDPVARWNGDAVRRALSSVKATRLAWEPPDPSRAEIPGEADLSPRVAETCEAVADFFEAAADPGSHYRLWPSQPEAYALNPVSIQFGACGPLEYMRRARGGCPSAWLDWVERRAVPDKCPPGLYAGLAGAAVTLAACGRPDRGGAILRTAAETPLLPTYASLYTGAAGVGVAALELADALDDDGLRAVAVRVGTELERCAKRRRHGLAWGSGKGATPCGLAGGASGGALFYTYLGACTAEPRYWELARRALEFEFSQARWRGGLVFWPLVATRRVGMLSPHVSFGTAGVATAAIRLYACTGEPQLLDWAARCARTLELRWTNKLWQDMGLAGWGETLLDLHAATGEARYRQVALRHAEALLAVRVETRFGTAFPGGGLNKVASDHGGGTSGIALFLHRLVHGGNRAFFPDHLLPGWGARSLKSNARTVSAEPAARGAVAEPGRVVTARAKAYVSVPA